MNTFDLRKYLAEGKLLKEELTWYVEDENEDIRFQNDEYLKEVGKKIKEIHPDISSEDLNKIIIMTGEQYSREEDFHGDSIPSGNFVDAAVEIYQTDVLGSDGEDNKDFDEWAPENLDGDFPKDSIFAGWTQAQYDAYQEEPRKYEKYLGGGSFNLAEGVIKENEEQGYTLYDTNVEYDNGKTGYMFQLVNSEDREENEIGFDQLFFDDEDNRLEMGVDFNSFDQGSYQEGEYTADEAMELYRKISEGVIKEDYKNDYANSEEDYTDSMVMEKIKDIIRYHELDPSDVLEEIGQEFGVAFEFGRG